MKKFIVSLLVLVIGATMVMAEVPTVTANSEQVVASTAIGTPSADLAFADVEGAPLGEAENAKITGGIINNFIGGAISTVAYCASQAASGDKITLAGAAVSFVVGAATSGGNAYVIAKPLLTKTIYKVATKTIIKEVAKSVGEGVAVSVASR
ncbi:MAG TPA: hypothetical protein PLB48_12340 [Treponema sp.]|nr:hypothetical protein [Treponema sp.]HRS05180.1 hypothetical protein [Treponema sp.]HRU29676.1 hypothetical protein [Treponema sp.]